MRTALIAMLALALYASPVLSPATGSRTGAPQLRPYEPAQTIYVERPNMDPITRWLPLLLSGIAIGWNIVVHLLSGPRVKVTTQMDMLFKGLGRSETEERTQPHVAFQAANRGDRPTTIYNAGLIWFGNWRIRATYDALSWVPEWGYWYARLAKIKTFDLYMPWIGANVLPFLLNPGTAWNGHADQDAEVLEMERTGLLYVRVYHYGGRAARGRIKRRAGVDEKPQGSP